MYDPVQYWRTRKDPNTVNPETKNHLSFLEEHLSGVDSILDFGPGVGRLFSAYKGSSIVVGCDVTDQHDERLDKLASEYGFDFELLISDESSGELPYVDDSFDAAVSVQVLLHQTAEDAKTILSELARVGKKIIIVSYWEEHPLRLSDHCFSHDYVGLCNELNINIVEQKVIGKNIYLIGEKDVADKL